MLNPNHGEYFKSIPKTTLNSTIVARNTSKMMQIVVSVVLDNFLLLKLKNGCG